MPFTKDKSRKTSSTGRPEKDPASTLEAMSQEEKREYWRKKKTKQNTSNEDPEPCGSTENRRTTRTSNPVETTRSRSSSPKRGRPPLGESAMTPRTLSSRKRDLAKQKYAGQKEEIQREHTSAQRSRSAAARWNKRINPDEGNDNNDNDDEVDMLTSGDESEEIVQLDPRVLASSKLKLKSFLSSNELENLDIFVRHMKSKTSVITLNVENYTNLSPLSDRQIRYKWDQINQLFSDPTLAKELMKFWIEQLLSSNVAKTMFKENQWDIPNEFLSRELIVEKTAAALENKFLRRDRTTEEQRKLGARYVIDVAKTSQLDIDVRGDVSHLAKYTFSSWKFAKLVLTAIKNGTEETLLQRKTRCDAIHADTVWTDRISEFVLRPENSRACPGQEKVSIKYGVRRPKFILRKSRAMIAAEFLVEYPDCRYKSSTIIREFPQNAVTASTRDRQRNSCPYHCNVRRRIAALHKVDIGKNISSSCREMVCSAMCETEHTDPTQWNEDCVYGKCFNCPNLTIDIPTSKQKQLITYSLWQYGFDEEKKRKQLEKDPQKKNAGRVFGLFDVTETISEAVKNFTNSLPKMKIHIYTAYSQWNAHAMSRDSLDDKSIITIEDYQQNLEVTHMENPTSMAYTTNKITMALFPVCVEYRVDGVLHKGAVVFLSDDKNHDLHTVNMTE